MWHPGTSSHLVIPPLLSYFNTSPGRSTRIILGTYWHRSDNYSRQNLLFLFDHRYYKDSDTDSYGLALGLARYAVSPEVREFRLFYGMVADYKNYLNIPDYDFDFLWFIITARRNGERISNSFLPLYYYSSDKQSWSFLSPIGLTYLSRDSDGDFDLGLLGLVYYRNNKIYEKKDRRMWLLGSLWSEVKRPERGYHSMGMLWGILWSYETEKETGYEKFSILKGLYKQTRKDGRVKRKFFWVF